MSSVGDEKVHSGTEKKKPKCERCRIQTFQNRLLTKAEMSMNDDNHITVMMTVITYNVKSVNNAEKVENFSVASQKEKHK
jgi:hypothetical protein